MPVKPAKPLDDQWMQWLSRQPQEKQCGLMLRAFRERQGILQKKLSKMLGMADCAVACWERGIHSIDTAILGTIVQKLELKSEDAVQLIILRRSDMPIEWLKDKLEHERYDIINFPALDEEWLDMQPQEKRAGLFLKACRERKCIAQKEFSEMLRIGDRVLAYWEIGDDPINVAKLGIAARKLEMNDQDAIRLISLRRSDMPIEWLKDKLEHERYDIINFPALDEEWLDMQPQEKRAGLLLEAFRERKGLLQRELGQKLGVSQNLVSFWELGKQRIPEKYHDLLSLEFNLLPMENDIFFRYLRQVDELTNKRAGKWIKRLRKENGDEIEDLAIDLLSGSEVRQPSRMVEAIYKLIAIEEGTEPVPREWIDPLLDSLAPDGQREALRRQIQQSNAAIRVEYAKHQADAEARGETPCFTWQERVMKEISVNSQRQSIEEKRLRQKRMEERRREEKEEKKAEQVRSRRKKNEYGASMGNNWRNCS